MNLYYLKQDRKCTYKRYSQGLSHKLTCRVTAITITYSDRVFVAFGIPHAMLMLRIVLSSMAYPAAQYFSTLPHWSFVYCFITLCVSLLPLVYCFTMCVLLSYVL